MENKFNLVQVQVLFTLGRCERLGWSKEGNRAVQHKHKEGEVRVGTASDSPCLCWHEIMVKLMGDVLLRKGKIHNFNSQFTTLAMSGDRGRNVISQEWFSVPSPAQQHLPLKLLQCSPFDMDCNGQPCQRFANLAVYGSNTGAVRKRAFTADYFRRHGFLQGYS